MWTSRLTKTNDLIDILSKIPINFLQGSIPVYPMHILFPLLWANIQKENSMHGWYRDPRLVVSGTSTWASPYFIVAKKITKSDKYMTSAFSTNVSNTKSTYCQLFMISCNQVSGYKYFIKPDISIQYCMFELESPKSCVTLSLSLELKQIPTGVKYDLDFDQQNRHTKDSAMSRFTLKTGLDERQHDKNCYFLKWNVYNIAKGVPQT